MLRVYGGAYTWRGSFLEFYGSFSMGFKYGRIPREKIQEEDL